MDSEEVFTINFIAYYNETVIPVSLKSNQLIEELKMSIFSFISGEEFSDIKLILEKYGDLENFADLPISCVDLSNFN